MKSVARTFHIYLCVATLSLFVLGREIVAQTNTFPPSGNTGVGTTSPWQKLTVIGTAGNREGVVVAGEGNPWVYTDFNLIPISPSGIAAGKPVGFAWSVRKDAYYGGDSSGPSLVMEIGRQGGGAYVPFIINPSGNLLLQSATNATNGNVGIGALFPAYKLDVQGGYTSSSAGYISKNNPWSTLDSAFFPNGITTAGAVNWIYGTTTYINNAPSNGSGHQFQGANAYLAIGGGSLGVGTITPNYRLDVQGGQINASGGLCIAGDCKTAWSQVGGGGSSQWTTAGSNIHYNTGNVGIGTGSPGARLHVSAGDSSFALFGPNATWGGSLAVGSGSSYLTPIAGRAQVLSSNGNLHLDGGATQNVYISWLNNSNTIINGQGGSVGINTQTPNSAYKLDVNGEINATGIRVNGNPISGGSQWSGTGPIHYTGGNVGIGTTTPPTEKLHVVGNGKFTGNLTVDGNINAKYQDVAEWVPSSEQLSAGTLVILDTTKANQVISSNQPYDTRVAGVISAQPGLTLGESGEGKVLVATTGRVRVKVDASRGPIQIGDLLVTSDMRGVAMKSVAVNLGGVQIHRPGTIIGKAVEPLAKGQGEILVLLSLQ